jgi:acetyltransferase-like isoleucine patch superfamily enzyme
VEFDTNHGEPIQFGDRVTPSHRCIIASHMATDTRTPLRRLPSERAAPVRSGRRTWPRTGAIVLPGVPIRENAPLAAGAVGSRDLVPASLAAGVPAPPVEALDLRGGA